MKFNARNSKASKLTPAIVMEMRERWASGAWTQGALSREYQLSVVQVGRIVRGESWQGVGMPLTQEDLQASQERFLAMIKADEGKEEVASPAAIDLFMAEDSAQRQMLADIDKQREKDGLGDKLVEELLPRNPLDE